MTTTRTHVTAPDWAVSYTTTSGQAGVKLSLRNIVTDETGEGHGHIFPTIDAAREHALLLGYVREFQR